MAKAAGAGRCTHCLKEVEERNWDHVLPEAWYPKSTPLDMEKWKVPSCLDCNREYGRIEQDLMIKFGLCLDPNHPDTKDIVEKALRSIQPEHGRDQRDQQRREQKQRKVLGDTVTFEQLPDHGVFPNFGPLHPLGPEGYTGVPLPKSQLERLTEKIVRGVAFVTDGILIEGQYEINVYILGEDGAQPIVEMIDKFGEQLHRGPGLLVKRAVMSQDRRTGFYVVEIWGRVKLYASVTPKEVEDHVG